MVFGFEYRVLPSRATPFELAQALFEPLFEDFFEPYYTMEDQQNQQHQQNQQNQQNQQQQQQQQNQHEGRQTRKRITKPPPDDTNSGERAPKRMGGGSTVEPSIPERTSSFPVHDAAEKKAARRKQRTGSTPNAGDDVELSASGLLTGAGLQPEGGDNQQHESGGGVGGHGGHGDDGDDSEATECDEAAPEPVPEPAPEPSRKGKGKNRSGRKHKENQNFNAGGGQEGKPTVSESSSGGGGSNNHNNHNNNNNHSTGNNQEGKNKGRETLGGDNDGDENFNEYAFITPHFVEEGLLGGDGGDYDDDDDGGHDLDHDHGDDDNNVIDLNHFPSGVAARMRAPPPRVSREDFLRTMASDRHSLQQTVQSLIQTLQREQVRRMTAEENLAVLEDNANVYKDLAAKFREEADRHKKGHTQVLRDLNRFKAGQGFSQMADDFLTQKARELRQDIRDFAIQYFDGDLEGGAIPPVQETKLGEFMRGVSPLDPFQSFLLSPTRCASAIESFLWVILTKTVFGGWYWAGGGRLPLHDVFAWMRPDDYSFAVLNAETDASAAAAADPEAERKFYTWRATTAKLVAERPGIMVRDNLRNKLVEEICATIAPYLRARDGSHTDELCNIVNKAIEFDRDTSQQASRLEWIFCRAPGQKERGAPHRFDPSVMDIQMWEETPTDQSEVLLVVAPGLRKRGRSNGEDYSLETMLLKMDVTCDAVTDMAVA